MPGGLWARPVRVAALSIGISRYQFAPHLPSCVRDAVLIAGTFKNLGFDTRFLRDPTHSSFLEELARWRLQAEDATLAVVYVAGHGVYSNGQTHVLATDTPASGPALFERSVSEAVMIRAVSDRPRQKVLFLDCCRSYAWWSAQIHAADPPTALPAGAHILYAAQIMAPALDGQARFSPFASALYDGLSVPGLDSNALARRVRLSVLQKTQGLQVPWERSSLLRPVTLNVG